VQRSGRREAAALSVRRSWEHVSARLGRCPPPRGSPLQQFRHALRADGVGQAVLSAPETLAALGCFETPLEDWPVSNPFVDVPALLCLGPAKAVLVVADFHAADVRPSDASVATYRSYDFRREPDPAGELRLALTNALAAMFREAGRRVPSILTVTAGAGATATGGGVVTGRLVRQGDLVLTDTSPWIDGAWSDTANAVDVGTPDADTRRRFDAVRRALHEGIALCRPGAVAREVDAALGATLSEHGPTYPHHSGHALGAAWSEEPRIAPYCELRLEEGMVLALERAIYLPGWGGIRLSTCSSCARAATRS